MYSRQFTWQLPEYFVQRMRKTYEERRQRLNTIQTESDALDYIDDIREAIQKAFAPFPKRTPLGARTTGVSEFAGYRIEHVIYDSRPGYRVTANLYLPSSGPLKKPAVLFPCGHSPAGKADPSFVATCIRLARTGYAVLIYDPVNQGERDIYAALSDPERPMRESPCIGHNIVGKQLHACGDWLGTWRVWDGIRGVDYLCERADIDTFRIGVTGQSGGGTLSAYLWANEPRLRMVASSCWTTSYLSDIENGMPADSEQYPPGWLDAGFDKIDFFIVRAGEPALLLGVENDFFDNRGLEIGYAELNRIHRLLGGEPELCKMAMAPGQHAYHPDSQTRMITFFNRVIGNKSPIAGTPEHIHKEEELFSSSSGQINLEGSIPLYDLIEKTATALSQERKSVSANDLPRIVKSVLRFDPPKKAPHYRRMFFSAERKIDPIKHVFRFLVETEPGILCALRQVQSEDYNHFRLDVPAEVSVFVPNICAQTEIDSPTNPMAGCDSYFSLDTRGLGEGLFSEDDIRDAYNHEYMNAGHALLNDETLLGMRVFDLLSTLRLLRDEGAESIFLTGRGLGALTVTLAALFDDSVKTVRAQEGPESFLSLTATPTTDWPLACYPRGVLGKFDLPDIRKALGKRLIESTFANASHLP